MVGTITLLTVLSRNGHWTMRQAKCTRSIEELQSKTDRIGAEFDSFRALLCCSLCFPLHINLSFLFVLIIK